MAAGLRQAFRRLARPPGFARVAILTLGLGIGANTAIVSVVDAGGRRRRLLPIVALRDE